MDAMQSIYSQCSRGRARQEGQNRQDGLPLFVVSSGEKRGMVLIAVVTHDIKDIHAFVHSYAHVYRLIA